MCAYFENPYEQNQKFQHAYLPFINVEVTHFGKTSCDCCTSLIKQQAKWGFRNQAHFYEAMCSDI